MSATLPLAKLTPKDLKTDQEIRWCPGCGDYAILNGVQKAFADLGISKKDTVIVSGIGCSSRFPYYMDTYGFHSIHGRAPAIATGVRIANPELTVWVVTGDGDGLSIGASHLLHAIRRNVDLKIILFNNRIYGLTKGQYSPTSELGKTTKSTPFGSVDYPMHPLSIAIGAEATFVARALDVDVKHLQEMIRRAAAHRGAAFLEVYQNCNVYNNDAFAYAADRETRPDNVVYLEHGAPLIFGANRDRGIRLRGTTPEIVQFDPASPPADLLRHDETVSEPTHAYLLSRMRHPEFPEPLGVFRSVRNPTYEERLFGQISELTTRQGRGDLDRLFNDGDTWNVPSEPRQ